MKGEKEIKERKKEPGLSLCPPASIDGAIGGEETESIPALGELGPVTPHYVAAGADCGKN